MFPLYIPIDTDILFLSPYSKDDRVNVHNESWSSFHLNIELVNYILNNIVLRFKNRIFIQLTYSRLPKCACM